MGSTDVTSVRQTTTSDVLWWSADGQWTVTDRTGPTVHRNQSPYTTSTSYTEWTTLITPRHQPAGLYPLSPSLLFRQLPLNQITQNHHPSANYLHTAVYKWQKSPLSQNPHDNVHKLIMMRNIKHMNTCGKDVFYYMRSSVQSQDHDYLSVFWLWTSGTLWPWSLTSLT